MILGRRKRKWPKQNPMEKIRLLPPNQKRELTKPKRRTIHRSSETGRFVPERYAKKHPSTTEKERVRTKKK